ncbi:hypothetical protein GGQ69_000222 [Micrococcus sp. TA1]|nr:hypothetical protein [Micrococcus sp. TA1]
MIHSNASNFPYIDPPTGLTVDSSSRIAYGPRAGDVASSWMPERDVNVVTVGEQSLATSCDLFDDLDAVVVAIGILGATE